MYQTVEELIDDMLTASTLANIQRVTDAAEAWLVEHPEDAPRVRSAMESVDMMRTALPGGV